MQRCYKCGGPRLAPQKAGFQDVCEECGSYLHCCLNCRFHDEHAHNHCAETQAEYVSDPNGMNRCEYFVFKESGGGSLFDDSDDTKSKRRRSPDWRNVRGGAREPASRGRGGGEKAQNARKKLDDLFRKSE